eukprot:298492_1
MAALFHLGFDILMIIMLFGCILGQIQYVGDWIDNGDRSCIYPWSSLLIIHFCVSIIDRVMDQCYDKSSLNFCICQQNSLCCAIIHILEIITRAIWIFSLLVFTAGLIVDIQCYKVNLLRFVPVITWILICNILLWYFIIKTTIKKCRYYLNGNRENNINDWLNEEIISNDDAPRPLLPVEINHLLAITNNKQTDKDAKCAICLGILYDKNLHCKQLPQCKHIMHSKCLDHWLKIRGDCPICRTVVVVCL